MFLPLTALILLPIICFATKAAIFSYFFSLKERKRERERKIKDHYRWKLKLMKEIGCIIAAMLWCNGSIENKLPRLASKHCVYTYIYVSTESFCYFYTVKVASAGATPSTTTTRRWLCAVGIVLVDTRKSNWLPKVFWKFYWQLVKFISLHHFMVSLMRDRPYSSDMR